MLTGHESALVASERPDALNFKSGSPSVAEELKFWRRRAEMAEERAQDADEACEQMKQQLRWERKKPSAPFAVSAIRPDDGERRGKSQETLRHAPLSSSLLAAWQA